jgi:hypothetical protein
MGQRTAPSAKLQAREAGHPSCQQWPTVHEDNPWVSRTDVDKVHPPDRFNAPSEPENIAAVSLTWDSGDDASAYWRPIFRERQRHSVCRQGSQGGSGK